MPIFHLATDCEIVKQKDGTYQISKYNGIPFSHLEFPAAIDGKIITSIGKGVLPISCENIKFVKISEGIKRIENNAFYCSFIVNIELPSTLEYIGDEAFYWSHLENVVIPKNVSYLGARAFSVLKTADIEDGCTVSLKNEGALRPSESLRIPNSITEIDQKIFWCAKATFSGYKTVRDVDGFAVRDSKGVPQVKVITGSSSDIIIPKEIKIYCNSDSVAEKFAKKLKIPTQNYSKFGPDPETLYSDFIDENATTLVVPRHIKTIKKKAFANRKLTSISFGQGSNLCTIEEGAFCGTLIKSITFPKGLTTIGKSAFSGCHELTSISFEEDSCLEEIGEEAFRYCNKYGNFSWPLVLPSSLKRLGEKAFADSGFSTVDMKNASLLTEIPKDAFYGCTALSKVVLPETGSVKLIGNGAFYRTKLRGVCLFGVEYIGCNAFRSCYYLKSVTVDPDCDINSSFDDSTTITREKISPPSPTILDSGKQLFGKIKNFIKKYTD